jgi:hypothetical protein
MIKLVDRLYPEVNFEAFLRDRDGKIVKDSIRRAHNVFTTTGKNWLSKLVAWETVAPIDVPYTQRRVRWMGVGTGVQSEVTSVTSILNPAIYDAGSAVLAPITATTHPTSTSVRFTRTYGTSEISFGGPVILTEAGLFADVNPYDFVSGGAGTEDTLAPSGTSVLDPAVGTNPPVAYKSFDPITKTSDFTFEIRWDFRF